MNAFNQNLMEIANAEEGVEEKPRGSNRGPRVDDYQRATWLETHQWGPWCAAFVCWCIMATMHARGMKNTATFKRPRTAGAKDFRRWSLEQGNETHTLDIPGRDIQRSDIVIYRYPHIGLADSAPDAKGFLWVVEGNTNEDGGREGYEVCRRRRHFSEIATRIRINEIPQ